MKNKILSFFACLTCCIFCFSPVSAFGATLDWVEIVAETVFSALLQGAVEGEVNGSDGKGLTGVAEQFIDVSLVPAMLDRVTQTANNMLSFTIPNYRIITGKYQLHYTFGNYDGDNLISTTSDDLLIECTILLSQTYDSNFNYTNGVAIDKNTGVTYYANSLNFSIYRTNGSVERFVCVYNDNMFSRLGGAGTSVLRIGQGYYCNVYDYSPSRLTRLLYSDKWTHGIAFYMSESNTITRNLSDIVSPPSSVQHLLPYPVGFGNFNNSSLVFDSLTTSQLSEGRASVIYNYNSSGSGRYRVNWYPLDFLFTSFYITNNNTDENSINSNWTTKNVQNYYIDNIYEGGTVINNDNKTTILGGALAPAFDIDTDLPFDDILDLLTDLLPDIKANLKPEIGFDIESLFDRLFDFYNEMPDIGLPWGDDDTNNYWDIEPPAPPDDGGGGGGTIQPWDPPEYDPVNTSVYIPAVVPSYSTYVAATAPAQVLTGGKNVFSIGYGFLDTLGIWSLVVPLAIVGIFWHFTGGD